MIPGACRTCRDPRRAEIDRELVQAQVSVRALARLFDVPKSSLQRHASNCLREDLDRAARAKEAEELATAEKLLEIRRAMLGGAVAIWKEAQETGRTGLVLAAMKEIRGQIELDARLVGRISGGGTTVHVHLDPETAQRMAEIYLHRRGALLAGGPAVIQAQALASPPPSEGEK